MTNAEFLILKDFDLAELRGYEQARDLTTDLLKKWLVQYKFKNWAVHESDPNLKGQAVTEDQKKARAEAIAKDLGDTSRWKSHGRPINMQTLRDMKLKVEDFGMDKTLNELIRSYYEFLRDYTTKIQMTLSPHAQQQFNFLHTRIYI